MYERAAALAPESPLVRFKRVRLLIALQRYPVRTFSSSFSCTRARTTT